MPKIAISAPSRKFVWLYLGNCGMYRQSEKNLLDNNICSTRSHNMVNVGALAAEICWRVWGTPANFNGFRILASLLHRRRSTEVNQTLHDRPIWPSPGLVHYITLAGVLLHNGILTGAKFTLRPNYLAFSYIDSITARQSSSGRQPHFAAFSRGATYIRQGGHHVGHRPTF